MNSITHPQSTWLSLLFSRFWRLPDLPKRRSFADTERFRRKWQNRLLRIRPYLFFSGLAVTLVTLAICQSGSVPTATKSVLFAAYSTGTACVCVVLMAKHARFYYGGRVGRWAVLFFILVPLLWAAWACRLGWSLTPPVLLIVSVWVLHTILLIEDARDRPSVLGYMWIVGGIILLVLYAGESECLLPYSVGCIARVPWLDVMIDVRHLIVVLCAIAGVSVALYRALRTPIHLPIIPRPKRHSIPVSSLKINQSIWSPLISIGEFFLRLLVWILNTLWRLTATPVVVACRLAIELYVVGREVWAKGATLRYTARLSVGFLSALTLASVIVIKIPQQVLNYPPSSHGGPNPLLTATLVAAGFVAAAGILVVWNRRGAGHHYHAISTATGLCASLVLSEWLLRAVQCYGNPLLPWNIAPNKAGPLLIWTTAFLGVAWLGYYAAVWRKRRIERKGKVHDE